MSGTGSGALGSLLFWPALYGAGLLFALLHLAPKVVEAERLRGRYNVNADQVDQLQQEVAHLSRLEHAYRHDAEFLNRVIARELKVDQAKRVEIPAPLNFDPHLPAATGSTGSTGAGLEGMAWIEPFAMDPGLRRRCWQLLAFLMAVAILSFNDWCSPLTWMSGLRRWIGPLSRRYQPVDEIGA